MFLLMENSREIVRKTCPIEETTTNNVAEYVGLIEGLKELKLRKIVGAQIFMDSQLIVTAITRISCYGNRMKGSPHKKAPHLIPFWEEASVLMKETNSSLSWIRNTENLVDPHTIIMTRNNQWWDRVDALRKDQNYFNKETLPRGTFGERTF